MEEKNQQLAAATSQKLTSLTERVEDRLYEADAKLVELQNEVKMADSLKQELTKERRETEKVTQKTVDERSKAVQAAWHLAQMLALDEKKMPELVRLGSG